MNFGCGKFDEATMLRYIEGTLSRDTAVEVDAHMRTCGDCLREVMELQRIDAVMDAGIAEAYPLGRRIALWIKGNVIDRFEASFDAAALNASPARGSGAQGVTGVKFETKDPDAEVTLFPGDKGAFGLTIDAKGWKGDVELLKLPGEEPFYLTASDGGRVEMKSIPAGSYRLTIGRYSVDIDSL